MADKKITELTELVGTSSDDLFVIVDDPTGTPITKKITAKNLFGNGISVITTNTVTEATVLKSVLTVNSVGNATTTQIAADFLVNTLSTSANATVTSIGYQYALRATSKLNANTSNVAIEHAASKFILDVGNTATVQANTYVSLLAVANSVGTRTANVQAFIGFSDLASNSTSAQTLYLFEIGVGNSTVGHVSSNVTTGAASSTTLFSNSAATAATHKLRVRINGSNYWLLLTDTAS